MSKTLSRDFLGGQTPAEEGNTRDEKRAIAVDWSQLPLDLISEIAGTLDEDLADRVRFGAVCKSWQSAIKPAANLPRVRIPWLCLQDDESYYETHESRRHTNFFSLGRNKSYDILNHRRQIVALSSHGWILTADAGKTVWLLQNPITKAQILLPPLPPSDSNVIYRSELIVTPDSLAVVMVGFSHGPILCYRRPLNPKGVEITEDAWTEIFCVRAEDVQGPAIEDVCNVFTFHQDRCFIIDVKQGITLIVDPDTRQVVSVIHPMIETHNFFSKQGMTSIVDHYLRRRYLISSSSGEELFLVISPSRTAKEIFEVFVLDRSDQHQAKWSKVRNIGQDVFFVDEYSALATLAPRDSNICRRNCITFLGSYMPCAFASSLLRAFWEDDVIPIGLFDIGNDRVEELTRLNCKDVIDQRWFLPSLSQRNSA